MDSLKKFCDLDVLAQVLSEHKKQGRKIVLCHGVFDLLHIGHIRYLRQSKQRGDILAVTITADQFVDKGPGRPVFTERLRAEFLASLDFVDYVAVNKWPTAENTLRFLQPHFYAKGAEFKNLDDQTGKIALEAQAAKEAGVELIFIEDIVFSSSSLINQNLSVYSEELTQYLNIVRQKYTLDDVLAGIDLMKNLKVLVVGDAIVDEYVYCSPLGLSSKDPTLVLHRLSSELFPGGAVAVARHLAGLAGQADIFTLLGANCPYRQMLRSALPHAANFMYEEVPNWPTVRKTRFIDKYSLSKIFETYDISDDPPPEPLNARVLERLSAIIGDYDLVLASDFGHGMISPSMIELLCRKARFLAVNTQANAGNRGYHTIFRYPRADFISLAQHEIRLACQDRHSPLVDPMTALFEKMRPEVLLVTCGADGAKAMNNDDFIHTPAVAGRVLDRVGSGDALFSVAALAVKTQWPLELVGLLGNVAGAYMVEMLGNNAAIDAGRLKKTLTAMLK